MDNLISQQQENYEPDKVDQLREENPLAVNEKGFHPYIRSPYYLNEQDPKKFEVLTLVSQNPTKTNPAQLQDFKVMYELTSIIQIINQQADHNIENIHFLTNQIKKIIKTFQLKKLTDKAYDQQNLQQNAFMLVFKSCIKKQIKEVDKKKIAYLETYNLEGNIQNGYSDPFFVINYWVYTKQEINFTDQDQPFLLHYYPKSYDQMVEHINERNNIPMEDENQNEQEDIIEVNPNEQRVNSSQDKYIIMLHFQKLNESQKIQKQFDNQIKYPIRTIGKGSFGSVDLVKGLDDYIYVRKLVGVGFCQNWKIKPEKKKAYYEQQLRLYAKYLHFNISSQLQEDLGKKYPNLNFSNQECDFNKIHEIQSEDTIHNNELHRALNALRELYMFQKMRDFDPGLFIQAHKAYILQNVGKYMETFHEDECLVSLITDYFGGAYIQLSCLFLYFQSDNYFRIISYGENDKEKKRQIYLQQYQEYYKESEEKMIANQQFYKDPILRNINKVIRDVTENIFLQVIDEVEILHNNKIGLKDLKDDNILIVRQSDDSFKVKICDFGYCGYDLQKINTELEPNLFRHPELTKNVNKIVNNQPLENNSIQNYFEQFDFYSIGQVLVNLPKLLMIWFKVGNFQVNGPAIFVFQKIDEKLIQFLKQETKIKNYFGKNYPKSITSIKKSSVFQLWIKYRRDNLAYQQYNEQNKEQQQKIDEYFNQFNLEEQKLLQ